MLASNIFLAATALVLESLFGYPEFLLRRMGHPVMWIGALIDKTEQGLNRADFGPHARKFAGIVGLLLWLIGMGVCGAVITWLCGPLRGGWLVLAFLATSLLAQRSLYAHVEAVADALTHEGLEGGRGAVAKIVGRDTADLGEAGVARAAIESLAENFSDGVVAPAFWLAIGGLTGGLIYKTINTADSMVGHRTARFADFGWASARLDDLVNLPASRLAAFFLVCAAASENASAARSVISVTLRDAPKHLSPNAGWPEAAMAGALGLKLGGPRVYGDGEIDGVYIGSGRFDAAAADIHRALSLFRRATFIQIALYLLVALLIWRV